MVIEDTWHPLSVYIFEESNMILRTAGYPGVSVKLNFNETRDINKSTCHVGIGRVAAGFQQSFSIPTLGVAHSSNRMD